MCVDHNIITNSSMSPTMHRSFQSCTISDESYCAPWDLKTQEEKLKLLNQQHQMSSSNISITSTDTLLHPFNIHKQSSVLTSHHTNLPFHRTCSVRIPSRNQSFSPRAPSLSVLPPMSLRGLVASRQGNPNNNNKAFDPTLEKISNCLNSHTIRSGTSTSRSFFFASSSSQRINTAVAKYANQPMSFETALFRFKCLSSSIQNNSLPKTPTSYEQPWTDTQASYLRNRHGRSLQKLPNTEETNRHCFSPTFSTVSSCRQSEAMATIPIERYFWYHYAISRRQAENILESRSPGSFLVRQSESGNQNDYSLSIKTINGCMHMRICYSKGFYILGECSRPFASVAHMILYFSQTSVPIRGATHIKLSTPVLRCELLSTEELL